MGDSTSEGIFAQLMHYAAETKDKALALKLFDLSKGYDFTWHDCDLDTQINTLGGSDLIRRRWSNGYEEWETLYRDDEHNFDEPGWKSWHPGEV